MKTNYQRGFVLPVTLVFLVILLIITLSILGNNLLKERMLGNTKDSNLAFQAAEACLKDAEDDIKKNINATSTFNSTCDAGLCEVGSTPDWSNTGKVRVFGQYTSQPFPIPTKSKPVYIIERLPNMLVSGQNAEMGSGNGSSGSYTPTYRVTAKAVGANPETVVILQSILIQ